MEYTRILENGQLAFTQSDENLLIPSQLYGFHNTDTLIKPTKSGKSAYCFYGNMSLDETELVCPECGRKFHIHAHPQIILSHLPIGGDLSKLIINSNRLKCSKCGYTKTQYLSFKADKHRITRELETFVMDLLALGSLNNKTIAQLTGLNEHIIKEIDKKRLQVKYTLDGKSLKKPDKTTRIIGIDEFKLHDHYQYATVILDMQTGHVLFISRGKGKQVVYDFINYVGMDWMETVECVSCDMNATYFKAFEEICEWIQPVFDHFHIIKNFNDKVISEIRKDEQKRLRKEGNFKAAEAFKKTRFILTSSRATLRVKDLKAGIINNENPDLEMTGALAKYQSLIKENELLLTVDIVKEKLDEAYSKTNEAEMAAVITDIMDICKASKNKHLLWFERLLDNHFEGIIARACYRISNSRLEGFNNRIKTVRRQAYGFHDDDYFFLKLFDISRQEYNKNPKSHKILQ